MKSHRPVDVITLLYILVVGVLILFFHRGLKSWWIYVAVHFTLAGLIWFFLRISSAISSKPLIFIRDWYPVLLYIFMFEEIGAIVNIIFPFWAEQLLMKLDYAIFRTYPTVWFERVTNPWLTEYMYFSYFTYFLLIPIGGGVLYRKKDKEKFNSLLFNVSLSYYLCYILFLFIPARGAWETLPHLHTIQLEGGFFFDLVNRIQGFGSIHGGAFPSSHVAAAFTVLFSIYKHRRKFFYPLLPVVLSLAVSIVYTRYHYAVDSLGGILIAILTTCLSPKIEKKL